MGSVRAQLNQILKIDGIDEQLKEAKALKERLDLHNATASEKDKKPIAIACNLAAELSMEKSLEQNLISQDPVASEKSIRFGLRFYEQAVEHAPKCIVTAAAYGGALIAANKFATAKVILTRGLDMNNEDCDHPFMNHIRITPASGNKEQLIAAARHRMEKDLAYIKEHEGSASMFRKVQTLLDKKVQCNTVLNVAKEVAEKQHGSARGKLLLPHVVLELIRSGSLMSNQVTDEKTEAILEAALKAIGELVVDCPNSLVISQYYAKLHVALGFYGSAEREDLRALTILNADDPRDHEVPFGCTAGVTYADRLHGATFKTICDLVGLFQMFECTFGDYIEELMGSFLSVKVESMLESVQQDQQMTGSIHDAIDYFKTNNSWLSWKCLDDSCDNFSVSTPEQLLGHIFQHASYDDDGTLLDKLSAHSLDDDLPCILDLAIDEEGKDVLCIKNIEVLFRSIFDVLIDDMMKNCPPNPGVDRYASRISTPDAKDVERFSLVKKIRRIASVLSSTEMGSISPDLAFASFIDHLSSLDDFEVQDETKFEVLEKLWVNVLKSSVINKQGTLMALIATLKWVEMKDVVETQISEAKTPVKDTSPETETLSQIPEPEGLEKSVAGAKPRHHAFMYGHRALVRRINVLSTVAHKKKVAEKEAPFDPYTEEIRHRWFVDLPEPPPHLSHHELCSACYFERGGEPKRCKHLLHHFAVLHDGPGIKCPRCGVRFVTASALSFHLNFIHNMILGIEQLNDLVIGPD